jgi:hypothetical protein
MNKYKCLIIHTYSELKNLFMVGFLSLSIYMKEQCLKLVYDHFLPHTFCIIIYRHQSLDRVLSR